MTCSAAAALSWSLWACEGHDLDEAETPEVVLSWCLLCLLLLLAAAAAAAVFLDPL